jgi:hypothetical protein
MRFVEFSGQRIVCRFEDADDRFASDVGDDKFVAVDFVVVTGVRFLRTRSRDQRDLFEGDVINDGFVVQIKFVY